jgi:hypothetical protein
VPAIDRQLQRPVVVSLHQQSAVTVLMPPGPAFSRDVFSSPAGFGSRKSWYSSLFAATVLYFTRRGGLMLYSLASWATAAAGFFFTNSANFGSLQAATATIVLRSAGGFSLLLPRVFAAVFFDVPARFVALRVPFAMTTPWVGWFLEDHQELHFQAQRAA